MDPFAPRGGGRRGAWHRRPRPVCAGAAPRCGGPSSIICAAAGASRRGSPNEAARTIAANGSRSRDPPPPKPKPNLWSTPDMAQPRTLFDKIWDSHVIAPAGEGTYLLYIDLHLCHEVTTPQAFEGLKLAGRTVRRPDATIAVADHNIPTSNRAAGIDEPESKLQVDTLERNVVEFGVPYFPIDSINQGIVHIIGPEQALNH